MGLFGKSDDSANSGSLWSRLTKNRKQEQQKPNNTYNTAAAAAATIDGSSTNQQLLSKQHSKQIKPHNIQISSDDQRKDNFRLSLQSLRPKSHVNSSSQNRASCLGTEQLDSRLRTSKLQCEQLKRKVATISLECSKLESQCSELREVKEQLLSFKTDITMLKRKEKGYFEIQQRISHLEDENVAMVDQIEHLRAKLSELKTEIRPDFINNRLDQLESDEHKLTSITLQTRRDHDRFSLDVGNQLVETFVTQQTIYEEFRRLQHRLVSVERQNQIMSDLIHFHCHNSAMSGNQALMTNSRSSRGAVSMQASTEAASSLCSPTFSDQDAEKTNTSPSNIDWQFTDQGDSLFLCDDTLNKSTEGNRELLLDSIKNKDYYKIDFTIKSESLTTLHLTDLSAALSASIMSTEEIATSPTATVSGDKPLDLDSKCNDDDVTRFGTYICERKDGGSTVTHQKDDGYYSTSHDGTMATDSTQNTDSVLTQRSLTVFQDNKERYFILTRHVQKSRGRSLRFLPLSKSNCTMLIKSSKDLETHLFNRSIRQRQHRQRESQVSEEDEIVQVFSDTELYGTRFCIDSDIDDDETPSLFQSNKLKPIKRNFGYPAQKSLKAESKHISNLPPLIEHVSERERKIEIKSAKKSKIVPPRVRPSTGTCYTTQKPIVEKSLVKDSVAAQCPEPLSLSIKPPKHTQSPKSPKTLLSPRKPPVRKCPIVKAPPIPPRPKKRFDLPTQQSSRHYELASLDYVNDPPIRMSPEGCQDLQQTSSTQMIRQFRDYNAPMTHQWHNDDCYMEDDEDEVKIVRVDNYVDQLEYYDHEFMSELENYQLPKSSVDKMVMQHFK